MMEANIIALEELSKKHGEVGDSLCHACNSALFPADSLAFSVIERSLQLKKGFCLLMRNGGYVCAVPILRMQLDSLLRFYGIITMDDPHETAQQVINKVELKKIKDNDGKPMTDKHLVMRLTTKIPQIQNLYAATCNYVHFSGEHFTLFAARSKKNSDDNTWNIGIGDDDAHISMENKIGLIQDFMTITTELLNMVENWSSSRQNHGNVDTLSKRFFENTI